MIRTTFTLDSEAYAFLAQMGGRNKSAYIARLLKEEKRRALARALLKANHEEAGDAAYQDELAAWEGTLSDGLES